MEGDIVYTDHSAVIGPDGLELARAAAGEALIVADLDPALFDPSPIWWTGYATRAARRSAWSGVR